MKIVKWLVVIVIVVAVWKVGIPWAKRQNFGGTKSSAASGDSSCTRSAQNASEAWGSGLAQFVNPPYDVNAWSSFKSGVESKIGSAEADCRCADPLCDRTRQALGELRGLVSEMDGSIRNGTSPPSDLVTRQERIDDTIAGN